MVECFQHLLSILLMGIVAEANPSKSLSDQQYDSYPNRNCENSWKAE